MKEVTGYGRPGDIVLKNVMSDDALRVRLPGTRYVQYVGSTFIALDVCIDQSTESHGTCLQPSISRTSILQYEQCSCCSLLAVQLPYQRHISTTTDTVKREER